MPTLPNERDTVLAHDYLAWRETVAKENAHILRLIQNGKGNGERARIARDARARYETRMIALGEKLTPGALDYIAQYGSEA